MGAKDTGHIHPLSVVSWYCFAVREGMPFFALQVWF